MAEIKKLLKSLTKGNVKSPGHPNINYDKKFIFIHIPKCAGTSIYPGFGLREGDHSEFKNYERRLGNDISNYFTFTFVRNPFARFLSLYNYARMDESYYHSSINPAASKFGKHLDYDILKNASIEECANLLIDNKLQHDKGWNHWRPQSCWMKDSAGNLKVDYIGRVESLKTDFYNLNRMLGTDAKPETLNRSVGDKDYKTVINASTRSLLEKYYEEDLRLFDYSF